MNQIRKYYNFWTPAVLLHAKRFGSKKYTALVPGAIYSYVKFGIGRAEITTLIEAQKNEDKRTDSFVIKSYTRKVPFVLLSVKLQRRYPKLKSESNISSS